MCLSRKINQSIIIGDNITITVVSLQGDKVRLGISAPKDIPVHRKEVYDTIRGQLNGQPIGPRPVPPMEEFPPEDKSC